MKNTLSDYLSSCRTKRREGSVLARQHIGHSYLTHSFFLNGEEGPACISCKEPLTLKHVFLQCMDLGEVRKDFFGTISVRVLFTKHMRRRIFFRLEGDKCLSQVVNRLCTCSV